jgi:hypothetical protein
MIVVVLEWAVVVGLSVAWLAVVGVFHLARRPPEPKPGPPTLDLPGDEPPAVVNLLTHRFRVTRDAVPATLLDLASRRWVELEHHGPERYVCRLRSEGRGALTDYEKRVLELLRKRAAGGIVPTEALTTGPKDESKLWWAKFTRDVIADSKRRGLSRDLLDKRAFVVLWVLSLPAAVLVGTITDGEPALAYAGVAAFLLSAVYARHPQRETPEGLAAGSRWLGVGEALRENDEFARQPPLAVALWERYLSYGAALGIAPGAVRPIPMGAESDRTAWSAYGGRWREVRVWYWTPPFPFERGESPRSALLRGLLIGGIGVAILYFLVRLADGIGRDDLDSDWRVWLIVIGVVGIPAVMALAGAIQTIRALIDLTTTREVTGQIVRLRRFGGEESGWRYHIAIDDGKATRIWAWPIRPELYERLEQGQVVTAIVTPNLKYVREVRPAAAHAETRQYAEPAL